MTEAKFQFPLKFKSSLKSFHCKTKYVCRKTLERLSLANEKKDTVPASKAVLELVMLLTAEAVSLLLH